MEMLYKKTACALADATARLPPGITTVTERVHGGGDMDRVTDQAALFITQSHRDSEEVAGELFKAELRV
jgi:hypothetical protein